MKKLFILFISVLTGLSLFAQTPESFKYQAVVRDATGLIVSDQTVGVQIQILEGSEYGSAIYVETHSPSTNNFGLINFNIGEGSIQNGIFEDIDWGNYNYFVKVSIDISGGSSYTDMGTSQLLSVPYALQSKKTENFDESDPVFIAHDVYGIQGTDITNWNSAYDWGNHASAGYLTSFSETDPIFLTHDAYGVTGTGITNWNTAYSWGNHASAGYLTSFSETDPQVGSNTTNFIPKWNGTSLSTGTIVDNGDIGIGTTNPTNKLHVEDDILAVKGNVTATGNYGYGVYGYSAGATSINTGVYGSVNNSAGTNRAVYGTANYSGSNANYGVYGSANNSTWENFGVYGAAYGTSNHYGVYGRGNTSTDNYAGYFYGNLHSTGLNTKAADAIKIDHPLDPENKYLYLSSVESPDMMNLFNGNVIIDSNGEAIVTMPDWFEAVNMDFRYQLTAVGAPGPNLYIKEKISNNQFVIAGGSPGMEVSWQVSGIRNDPFASKNRINVEEEKPANERGKYLHPQLYNQPLEKGVDYENNKHGNEEMNRPDAGIIK